MNETKTMTKDPVCGMTVDEATAIHAERDGKTYYFCGEGCRQKFLSTPPTARRAAAVDKQSSNGRMIPEAGTNEKHIAVRHGMLVQLSEDVE